MTDQGFHVGDHDRGRCHRIGRGGLHQGFEIGQQIALNNTLDGDNFSQLHDGISCRIQRVNADRLNQLIGLGHHRRHACQCLLLVQIEWHSAEGGSIAHQRL